MTITLRKRLFAILHFTGSIFLLLLICISIIGIIGYVFVKMGESVIPGASNRYTQSIEPITLTLTNDEGYWDSTYRHYYKMQSVWRIPKAYMINSRNWKGGDQFSIEMSLVYPEMQPVSLLPNRNTHDRVTVRIQRGVSVRKRQRHELVSALERAIKSNHRLYVMTHIDEESLQYFRQKRCFKGEELVSCLFDPHDTIKPIGSQQFILPLPETVKNSNDVFRMSCSHPFLKNSRNRLKDTLTEEEKQEYVNRHGCTIHISHNGHRITYSIRRLHFSKRLDIERKVREFLDALWIDTRQVKTVPPRE